MSKEPGNRTPAPGPLRLVQAFVNSVDREHAVDDFARPAGLVDWLMEQELWSRPQTVTESELAAAVELRETLRAVLLANNTGPRDAAASAVLDRLARAAPLELRCASDGRLRLEPSRPGVDGALARILATVHTAMVDGTWQSMKACKAEVCEWAYYDRSKNRSSQWCSMSLCGARAKMRAYRRRTATTG